MLQDAEGNHCTSFPGFLLQLVQSVARLSNANHETSPRGVLPNEEHRQSLLSLLDRAQSFDPFAWAASIQRRSLAKDLIPRTHMASAHRAAVCIYLCRILLSLYPDTQIDIDLEDLAANTVDHLSRIGRDNALFSATTWPTFVAGAEAHDESRQLWVTRRFEDLWEVQPWGLIKGALSLLESIWESRQKRPTNGFAEKPNRHTDWIRDMRERGTDWLIL